MKPHHLAALFVVSLGSLAGCGASRDVEVTGSVASSLDAPIVVEFYEVTGEGEAAERNLAHTTTLDAAGDFKLTVPLEGDSILIRAIADADGDEKCSSGDAWAEVEAKVAEDKIADVTLTLAVKDCPASE